MDWSYLQSFALVAEHGSMSAAARVSGKSQPTLSRHISELETDMGHRLLMRSVSGIELTPEGTDLFERVSAMANQAALIQGGGDSQRSGTVRITASQIIATFVLPDILAQLHQLEPELQFEVVASNEAENLLRREADIAVRMYRPTQDDLIARKIGGIPMGVYAAQGYLSRNGTPTQPGDFGHHAIIGYDRSSLIIDSMAKLGIKIGREFFAYRSDDQVTCWQMLKAGCGIGFAQTGIAAQEDGLVRLFPNLPIPKLPIWLAAHAQVKTTPRVRYVYDHLAKALQTYCAACPQ